jgi:N-glycosylase/DNA lyase
MSMIASLSKTFGQQRDFGDSIFFEFPKPSALAEASLGDLRRCGLGFRAKRVREVARIVSNGELDFQMMKKLDYEKTKRILLKLPGVGNKVADCIMLFSLEKLEAFPVDIWMKRAMQRYYATNFDDSFIEMVSEKKSLSFKEYNAISHFARGYFERFAGYAQQYLYHFIRGDSGSKRWTREGGVAQLTGTEKPQCPQPFTTARGTSRATRVAIPSLSLISTTLSTSL